MISDWSSRRCMAEGFSKLWGSTDGFLSFQRGLLHKPSNMAHCTRTPSGGSNKEPATHSGTIRWHAPEYQRSPPRPHMENLQAYPLRNLHGGNEDRQGKAPGCERNLCKEWTAPTSPVPSYPDSLASFLGLPCGSGSRRWGESGYDEKRIPMSVSPRAGRIDCCEKSRSRRVFEV